MELFLWSPQTLDSGAPPPARRLRHRRRRHDADTLALRRLRRRWRGRRHVVGPRLARKPTMGGGSSAWFGGALCDAIARRRAAECRALMGRAQSAGRGGRCGPATGSRSARPIVVAAARARRYARRRSVVRAARTAARTATTSLSLCCMPRQRSHSHSGAASGLDGPAAQRACGPTAPRVRTFVANGVVVEMHKICVARAMPTELKLGLRVEYRLRFWPKCLSLVGGQLR